MTVIGTDPHRTTAPEPAFDRRGFVLKIVVAALSLVLAVAAGANASTLGYLKPITLVVALGAMFVLTRVALSRFEWFVWIVLLVRPLLDLAKPNANAAAQPSSQLATLVGGIVIIAGIVWFAALARRGEALPMSLISQALVLLTLSSLVSVILSKNPVASFGQVARTTGAVVIFVVLEQLVRTRRVALQTLVVCGIAGAIPLIMGLLQIPFRDSSNTTVQSRISGTFLHPNTFGFFLVMLILMLYPLRRYVSRRMRRWFWAAIVVGLIELVLTASRGSWLVLVVGFGVIGLLIKEERKIFWIGPALAALTAVAFPSLVVRVTDLGKEDTLGGRPGNSASWRLEHYLTLVKETDISVFGIGPKMTEELTEGGKPPHNDFLRLLLENGVLGLMFYTLFIVGLVLVARQGLRYLRSGFDRALAVGFMAVVIAFVCNSSGSNVITQFVLLIYLLALAAIVQALTQLTAGAPAAADGGTRSLSASVLGGTSEHHTQNGTAEGPTHGNP